MTAPQHAKETFTNSVGMTFVKIPAGSFMMGSADEKSAHKVTLTTAFHLQTTVVTQRQWKTVMGTTPWKGEKFVQEGGDYPAVNVSWEDAQAFIQKLNAKSKDTYRLPTEAEWEYACRAGTTTKYSFGDDERQLGDYAWFTKTTNGVGEPYPHRVGTKLPNPWSLYDMHGNVWEWCLDWWGAYSNGDATDPLGALNGMERVLRGGSWGVGADQCSSSHRSSRHPRFRLPGYGFRVVYSGARTKLGTRLEL